MTINGIQYWEDKRGVVSPCVYCKPSYDKEMKELKKKYNEESIGGGICVKCNKEQLLIKPKL